MKILSLQPEAIRLVTPELASGSLVRWPSAAWEPLVTDANVANVANVDAGGLEAVLDEAIARFSPHATAIDAWLAPRLHRALPMTRRQASNAGIWRFMTVVQRPDIVRHRWENQSWTTMRSRFWSIGTRHTSNVLARLWWIAELTRDRDRYELTERVLSKQSLAIQVFVRGWSQHRPAVEAFVDAFEEAPGDAVERAARKLSRYLAAVPLEALDRAAIGQVIGVRSSD